MTLKTTSLTILLLAAFLLAACAIPIPDPDEPQTAGEPPAAPSLEGPIWQLQSLNGEPVLPGSSPTARFDNGQISGNAGCNNYFGIYEVNWPNFTLSGPLGSTEMFCENFMDQEQAFFQALQAASRIDRVDPNLVFSDSDGNELLVFSRQEDASLEGPEWRLDSVMIGGDAVASVINGSEVTAVFDPGTGKMTGSAGCNSYSAGYQLDGQSLSIGPAIATRKFCAEPQGLMDQEDHYLRTLDMVAGYEITGNSLLLLDENGSMLLGFVTG